MPYSMFGSVQQKTVSPERRLSALFRCSEKDRKERRSFTLGHEYTTRTEKWILWTLNAIGAVELLFGILSFFSFGLWTDVLRVQNLALSGIVLGYDLFVWIRSLVISLRYSSKRRSTVLSVYFFKDSFLVSKERYSDKKDEKEYPYSELRSMKETKHFFFLEIQGKETLYLDKSFFNTDKVELDGIRLKLIKASGTLISLETKIRTKDYQFALDQCEGVSLKNSLLKYFAFLLFVPPYFALLINFRSTDLVSCMDMGYLFFIGGGIETVLLVLTCLFRAKSDKVSRFFFRFDWILTLLFAVLCFAFGGLTYTFHFSLSYDSLRKEYTALSGEELPPSERTTIDADSCFYRQRTLEVYFGNNAESHTYYESHVAGCIDSDGDTASSFLTKIESSPNWKKTASDYKKYSPVIADIANTESDYFSLFVATPNDDSVGDGFFPSVSQINDSSNAKGQEAVIYFVSYQVSLRKIELCKYNYYYSKYMLSK